jgi:hypothetical protein
MAGGIGKKLAIVFGGIACLLLLVGVLVLSSPHGIVSGSVYAGFYATPANHQSVIFEEVDGERSYATQTDRQGRFRIALPPGAFDIYSSSDCSAGVGFCRFAAGPRSANIEAGQHLHIVLQTCGDKCPG